MSLTRVVMPRTPAQAHNRISARNNKNTLGRALVLVVSNPAGLITSVWALWLLLYLFGPIDFARGPSLSTWLFAGGCISAFLLGSVYQRLLSRNLSKTRTRLMYHVGSRSQVERWIGVSAYIGLSGMMSILVASFVLGGFDYSQGLAYARIVRRTMGIMSGGLLFTILVSYSILASPFGVVSFLLYILHGDRLINKARWLAYSGLLPPAIYSIVLSGRSPIFVTVVTAIGAVVIRLRQGRPALPHLKSEKWILVALVFLSIVYSNFTFADRRQFSTGADSYQEIVNSFDQFGGRDSVWFRELHDNNFFGDDVAMNILMTEMYFTHGISVLERVLTASPRLGPYYGQSQFFNLALGFSKFVPGWDPDIILQHLSDANVGGLFSTALGSVYLDFGFYGSFVFLFLFGWLSQRVFQIAIFKADVGYGMLMSYVVGWIMVSPVISMFSMSISVYLLVAILIVSRCIRHRG
jgi:hypothetical protein